jgi:hypothetical protein
MTGTATIVAGMTDNRATRCRLDCASACRAGAVTGFLMLASFCAGADSNGLIEKSGAWDRIQDGEYLVENCTWNVQAARHPWQETIFCDPATGSRGWRWDFSGEDAVTKTYPEIIYGRKPFAIYTSTTSRLPTTLSTARFRLEYEYVAKANGIYNTTTDISFTDSTNPGPANIRAKLMIWFDHKNMPFFESPGTKRAVIGGRPHQVFIDRDHVGPEGKWVFIALLPENLPARGELNLREYFDYLLSEGALKPEWFLSSIEAGSEIASGKGEIAFKRFVVR